MSFPDPIAITIDGTAVSLPRVSTAGRSAIYADKAGTYTLNISHTNGKRERSVIQLQSKKMAPDVLNPSLSKPVDMRAYLVVDVPPFGFSDTEAENIIKALTTYISTAANLTRFTGQES